MTVLMHTTPMRATAHPTVPSAARDLIAGAQRSLAEAIVAATPAERYACAHLSALRAAAAVLAVSAWASDAAKRAYDLPAGDAAVTLRQLSEASRREILFAAEVVRGVTTNPVRGELTALEAGQRLLAGTPLVVLQDDKTGALAVRRSDQAAAAAGASAPGAAPEAGPEASSSEPKSQDKGKVVDADFEVVDKDK